MDRADGPAVLYHVLELASQLPHPITGRCKISVYLERSVVGVAYCVFMLFCGGSNLGMA